MSLFTGLGGEWSWWWTSHWPQNVTYNSEIIDNENRFFFYQCWLFADTLHTVPQLWIDKTREFSPSPPPPTSQQRILMHEAPLANLRHTWTSREAGKEKKTTKLIKQTTPLLNDVTSCGCFRKWLLKGHWFNRTPGKGSHCSLKAFGVLTVKVNETHSFTSLLKSKPWRKVSKGEKRCIIIISTILFKNTDFQTKEIRTQWSMNWTYCTRNLLPGLCGWRLLEI